MREWIGPTAVGTCAVLVVGLAVVLWRVRARTARELERAQAEAAALRARMQDLEARLTRVARTAPAETADYVITHLGEEIRAPRHAAETSSVGVLAPRIEPALFADLVLRETVVKAASLAHGLRVALAPATRNRIRFEVRQEVKRARKQRRAELKEARREREARQRADLTTEEDAA
ncbi:MAG TPA: hypothetical protein VFT00_06460 [Nocardioides sp.]|nr:hypothetical protein [Nocardioides sp.]